MNSESYPYLLPSVMQYNSEKTTTTSDSGHKADPIEFTRSLAALSDKRIDILRRIKETGSISEAARASGVSYKAAWQARIWLAESWLRSWSAETAAAEPRSP